MHRLQITLLDQDSLVRQSLEAPDIGTALVVAGINMGPGRAEIRDGNKLLATLEKEGRDTAPFWRVR